MFSRKKITLVFAVFTLVFVLLPTKIFSISCEETCDSREGDDKASCLAEVKRACEDKIKETDAKKQTLQSALNFLNSKIGLTQSQINETVYQIAKLEDEIDGLEGKISTLDLSLDQITLLLSQRIKRSYKSTRINPVYLFFRSDGFKNFISRYKYLKIAQQNDRNSILELERARANYDKQKTTKKEVQTQVLGLQTDLLGQKQTLDVQQIEKEQLLVITKHDESRYQDLLSKANAELAAIQAIIAGKGEETEVGGITQSQKIATVIPGASACSTGGHLHFEVAKSGVNHNPANYLTSKSVTWDNAPDGAFGFSGSWQWPINDPVRITQGYGMTYYARVVGYYSGNPHTGIDMVNTSDYTVKAVQSGTLYRGSIACGGGTLRYVRIKQTDSFDTYYLHVNYF
ncbi:coiled-coil domain-containing protein [Patescibacteria group bacterium]